MYMYLLNHVLGKYRKSCYLCITLQILSFKGVEQFEDRHHCCFVLGLFKKVTGEMKNGHAMYIIMIKSTDM